jgi:hypothetical protein
MIKRELNFILAISILCLNIITCQATQRQIDTTTPTATATRTPLPTSTAISTPTPIPIEADPIRKLASSGFSYAPLHWFAIKSNNHEVLMTSPDANISIILRAETPFSGRHVYTYMKYLVEDYQKNYYDTVIGERLDVEHAGATGVSTDITGKEKGWYFHTRATILRPEKGKQLFILITVYGMGNWDRLGEKIVSTILDNITFLPIEPWIDCPVATNREYGFTKEKPVKIGGKINEGPDHEADYLSALLGPHGELVAYFRAGSLESSGVTLENIEFSMANETKTLYIDMYNFDSPKAPFGMTCSGPFPQS